MNKICMIGLGYIGLPTATMFASRKIEVVGVDVVQRVVDTVNQGNIHIVEPELDMLVHAVVTEGFLRASTTPESADAFLIAVPTPFADDHCPDVSYVETAAISIAPVLKPGDLVVLESTSPVGTTEKLSSWLAAQRPDLSFPHQSGEDADVHVAYCPERVLPGRVVHELVANDRIIGGMTQKASDMAVDLYKTFVAGECIVTNARTAEMCKLTENSFRDVNIALANELSMICEKLEINVWELIALANRHPRVNILQPGAGVGGHCIAVDPWFIVNSAPDEARLIRAAREINDSKPKWVLRRINDKVNDFLAANPSRSRSSVCVIYLGLAFKPNIDDLRESPAVEIVLEASHLGCETLVVEPHIEDLPASLKRAGAKLLPLTEALQVADVVCVLVKHNQFIEKKAAIQSVAYGIDAVGLLE